MKRILPIFVLTIVVMGSGCSGTDDLSDHTTSASGQSTDQVAKVGPNPEKEPAAGTDETALETEPKGVELKIVGSADEMARQREMLDKSLWAPEVAAQKHETPFVRLWDRLRATAPRWDALAKFPFQRFEIGNPAPPERHELGIESIRLTGQDRQLTPVEFRQQLDRFAEQGYQLVQSEWHHAKFEPSDVHTARSTVSVTLHISRDDPVQRVIITAKLLVEWSGQMDELGNPLADKITATDVRILRRDAAPAFKEILRDTTTPKQRRIMPLIVYDLDADGLSEIILGGINRVYRNRGGGKFEAAQLLEQPVDIFDAAIVADFSGDGHPDLVCVSNDRKPRIFEGDGHGRFPETSRVCADVYLELPKSFTAGDIDGDGDLDLWIGQYKFPYVQGSMPSPFYDADDGYPSVLLENNGQGQFADITKPAGLDRHRNRRTFSSSLIDLDDDGDLDLITVNDFCGIDLYANNGDGNFEEVTDAWVDQRHLFGMGHTFADYDLDGRLDMYVIGMSSTTARRLEYLKLGRKDRPDINQKRMDMAYGNRMLLRNVDGNPLYQQASFADQVARTGWSWGTSSFDLDNDGDRDIYVANGHDSGKSVQDYCTRYWCHDVYEGTSAANAELFKHFGDSLKELHSGNISWNGFEKNVLFLNERGRQFINIGFLLGVAFEFDSRGVVTADLDADGRPDLLVVEYQGGPGGIDNYLVHVLRNELETPNHWIGVNLRERDGRPSPIGAHVTVRAGSQDHVARLVTGDSFSSQHPLSVHFGLGEVDTVDWLEIRWPDGTTTRLEQPAVDRYHRIGPDEDRS